jgi:beta-glucosidase
MLHSIKRITLLASLALFSIAAKAQNKVPQLGKDPIPDIIKSMTLEEKVRVVVGKGLNIPGIIRMVTDKEPDEVEGISGHMIPQSKFGIPGLDLSDGPAGINRSMSAKDSINNLYSTAWPTAATVACSWDISVAKRLGAAHSNEAKDYGVDFVLFPAMNLQRNPLCGRNFEYYSEDPFLTGKMAASAVHGIQSTGVGATPKHFAANNVETNRSALDENISERALREMYLKGFEIVVKESNPWAIMTSYNKINGVYTSEDYGLLTTVVRDEWGYKGFLMTDWLAGRDVVAQMKAGQNLLMPGTRPQMKAIMAAVKNGQLSEKVIDDNAAVVLRIVQQTLAAKGYKFSNKPDLAKNAQISREAASECLVLLKNNNVLPLKNTSNQIAVFGNHAFSLIAYGTGSGSVSTKHNVSLAEGLRNAGYKLNPEMEKVSLDYLADYNKKNPKKSLIDEFKTPTPLAPEYKWSKEYIDQSVANSDVAIVYLGRAAGENTDRSIADFNTTALENELIDNVCNAYHAKNKKVVVVVNSGGVINVMSFRDKVDAILYAWTPGIEGGNAMADIISGKVNPSGKLAITFPVDYKDVPSSAKENFPGIEFPDKAYEDTFARKIPSEVTYNEGVYVGYRYYNTFKVKTAYEFGYGMSYTNFSYSPVKLSGSTFKNKITATVTITNTGKVAGKEVVQLYLSAPAVKLDKPSEELRAFGKTNLLQPGQSQTMTFTIDARDLSSYDTKSASWIAEGGKYTVKIGASSVNFKSTASFQLPKELMVEKAHNVCTPKVTFDEMKVSVK